MKSNLCLADLIGCLFIALKLCHVIDWSWWWVLAPIWIPLVLKAFVAVFKDYQKP